LTTKSKAFDELLLIAVDEALSSLGESAKQSIYFHIETSNVTRNKIPENLQEFQGGLEKIFGVGARFIEILIMKNLYAKIGQPLIMEKSEQLEFIEYVNAAKQGFLKNITKQKLSKVNSPSFQNTVTKNPY
jgi:predicted RND superfamily exporter protein